MADPSRLGACVVSRVALGVLSDKQSPHRLGFFAMAASAVAVSVLWGVACEHPLRSSLTRVLRAHSGNGSSRSTATTFVPLIVFALVMGLCSGGWTSLYSAIIKSLVGASTLAVADARKDSHQFVCMFAAKQLT